MKLVYCAGPYRASTPWEVEQHVRRAEETALKVWEAGAVGVAPQVLTRFYDKVLPDFHFMDGMLSLLARCDALLLVEGWEWSEGTQAEIAFAQARGIPVFFALYELQEWLQGAGSEGSIH